MNEERERTRVVVYDDMITIGDWLSLARRPFVIEHIRALKCNVELRVVVEDESGRGGDCESRGRGDT